MSSTDLRPGARTPRPTGFRSALALIGKRTEAILRHRATAAAILVCGVYAAVALALIVVLPAWPPAERAGTGSSGGVVRAASSVRSAARPLAASRSIRIASSALVLDGRWERVTAARDGRFGGASRRSFRAGSRASATFDGRRLIVYGVRGPGGGSARLSIDGVAVATLDFFAPSKRTGVPIYASPALEPGRHRLEIVVLAPRSATPHRRYVNVDELVATS